MVVPDLRLSLWTLQVLSKQIHLPLMLGHVSLSPALPIRGGVDNKEKAIHGRGRNLLFTNEVCVSAVTLLVLCHGRLITLYPYLTFRDQAHT